VLELLKSRKPTDMVTIEAGGAWGSDVEVADGIDGNGLSDVLVKLLSKTELSADRIKLMLGGLEDDDERARGEWVGMMSPLVEDTVVV
jgi:hypothetical protein